MGATSFFKTGLPTAQKFYDQSLIYNIFKCQLRNLLSF